MAKIPVKLLPHMNPQEQLIGGNVITHMRQIAEMESIRFSYFHSRCPLWAAIHDHIRHADPCVIIHRQPQPMMYHRGGSPIRLLATGLYAVEFEKSDGALTGADPHEPEHFWMRVSVEYDESRDGNLPERDMQYDINAPTELAVNFSTAAFEEWLAKLAMEREIKGAEKVLDQFDRICRTYATSDQVLKLCSDRLAAIRQERRALKGGQQRAKRTAKR